MKFFDLGFWQGMLPKRINPHRRIQRSQNRIAWREAKLRQASEYQAGTRSTPAQVRRIRSAGKGRKQRSLAMWAEMMAEKEA